MEKMIEMMNRAEKMMIDQMTNEQYSAYMSMPRDARFRLVAALIGEAFY